MKTVPPEKEYHDTEMQDDTIPESRITRDGLKTIGKNTYQSHDRGNCHMRSNSVIECPNSSESDSLIICSPELAASFQTIKTEKHKLNPGHYLQKVFLNSVAQKFRSQSLPSCLEKKKYQKNTPTDVLDELNEISVPLVESTETGFVNIDGKESFTDGWFKTWPERGIDKVQTRKGDTYSDEKFQNEITCEESSVDGSLPVNEYKETSNKYSPSCRKLKNGYDSKFGNTNCDFTKESHSFKETRSNGDIEITENINLGRPIKENLNSEKSQSNSKSIPLDELLDNFPLAYSPITKQLLLIKSNPERSANSYDYENNAFLKVAKPISEEDLNLEESVNDKVGGGKGLTVYGRSSDCDLSSNNLHRASTEVSSFSSTVSSLSDNSPSTNEDSALGSLLDHGDTCSLVSIGDCSAFSEDSVGAKPKKKSLTGFLSKNVFNWKSGSRSEDSIARSGTSWKIFGKNTSPLSSHTSLTVDHYAESDGWSLAPDSPCSVRSSSSGPRTFTHENRVASSSALIQLDRPANLPAKSEEEEARHRLEYQQMVEAARKRDMKDAKQRKKQLQVQLRAEEQLAQATRVWCQEILPRWDQMHTSKKARELWWQGVPPCVRGKVWKLAIGNPLNLTHSLYDICVQRAQDRLRNGGTSSDDEDSDNKEASMQLIQLDISRTFPHLCIFQKGGPYYDMLHCLLAAYVCYRPDVGYVQGMSFIAAVLILNMEAADAFVCFANLLNRPCHMTFFHLNQPLMQAYYSTYNELFKENLPQLFNHFTSTTLSPDLYLLDWIYTVFTKTMSLDLASRVWDVFLRDGEQFLFRTALGVLHMCQETLLQMDFVHGSQFLTRLPDDLSGDQLFKSISYIKMTVGKQTFEDILAVNSIDCH